MQKHLAYPSRISITLTDFRQIDLVKFAVADQPIPFLETIWHAVKAGVDSFEVADATDIENISVRLNFRFN